MHRHHDRREGVVECFMLGTLEFDVAMALQQRLVYELGGRDDGQIALLICEHPRLITIGRQGSRDHVRLSDSNLEHERLSIRWVNRGGGCLMHLPGQLAIYPIVPLAWYGLRVGEYLDRFQAGLNDALGDLRVTCTSEPGRFGIWGRNGQLAFVGAAVKNWTTYFGAYLNIRPAMRLFRYVQSDPEGDSTVSSIAAEQRRPLNVAAVRAALVPRLSEALGCERYHLYTSHPLLKWARDVCRERDAAAGYRPETSRRAG